MLIVVLLQVSNSSAGRGAHGTADSLSRKAGAWGAVQKTLQVITDRTLDVASSRLSSMALGAVSLKESYIVDKARAVGLCSTHKAHGLENHSACLSAYSKRQQQLQCESPPATGKR